MTNNFKSFAKIISSKSANRTDVKTFSDLKKVAEDYCALEWDKKYDITVETEGNKVTISHWWCSAVVGITANGSVTGRFYDKDNESKAAMNSLLTGSALALPILETTGMSSQEALNFLGIK